MGSNDRRDVRYCPLLKCNYIVSFVTKVVFPLKGMVECMIDIEAACQIRSKHDVSVHPLLDSGNRRLSRLQFMFDTSIHIRKSERRKN